MAKSTVETIKALRNTAQRIQKSNLYQWGHMGSCNCGFLAQEVCHLNKDEIHTRAMEGNGDWSEQLNDYCPTSGLRMDDLISSILNSGFDADDLKHLERLSDPKILRAFPFHERNLRYNLKSDVVQYLRKWATLLESDLLEEIDIKEDLFKSLNDPVADNIKSSL